MALQTSGTISKALLPGVRKFYGTAYKKYTPEYPQFFDVRKSSRAWEEDVGVTGFGNAPVISEGNSVAYSQQYQGYVSRYVHVEYGLGFIITRNAYDDNLYKGLAKSRSEALAFSMKNTKETVHANVLNRAFSSLYTGGDGIELCSLVHPRVTGGTYANELTVAADLSEAALEQACIDIAAFTDDAGGKINIQPRKLIIPANLQFDAARILQSALQNDTANNAINALRVSSSVPEGFFVSHYVTDEDAWFLITDCPSGLLSFVRRPDDFSRDNDFDTQNFKFKATARYSAGWTNPMGIFGSPGA